MTRLPAKVLALALLVSFGSCVAFVAGAEEPRSLRMAMERASPTPRLQEKPTTDVTPKKSFFKTRRGIMIVSLSAVAIGFTFWSKQSDRVHSPVR